MTVAWYQSIKVSEGRHRSNEGPGIKGEHVLKHVECSHVAAIQEYMKALKSGWIQPAEILWALTSAGKRSAKERAVLASRTLAVTTLLYRCYLLVPSYCLCVIPTSNSLSFYWSHRQLRRLGSPWESLDYRFIRTLYLPSLRSPLLLRLNACCILSTSLYPKHEVFGSGLASQYLGECFVRSRGQARNSVRYPCRIIHY